MLDTTLSPDDSAASTPADSKEPQGIGVERTFDASNLLFSRTDGRGVIESGNASFQEISGFEWSELIGAPHKMVRHDDMPKAVFQIFWDTISQNKPIVAYVKNKTKGGDFYWVLALVTPIEGGYISVRLKPQSKYFALAKAEYEARRRDEKETGVKAKESADRMLSRLAELGFDSYDAFAAAVVAEELTEFNKSQGRDANKAVAGFLTILSDFEQIKDASKKVAEACETVDVLPTNLQIQSARCGAIAAPLGIIAQDCGERTTNLALQMDQLASATEKAKSFMNRAILGACGLEIQSVMLETYLSESSEVAGLNFNEEAARLKERNRVNYADTAVTLKQVKAQVVRCLAAANGIDRQVVALNVTRSMCNIESSFIGENAATIRNIVDELAKFQDEVPGPLQIIMSSLNRALEIADSLLESRSRPSQV